MKQNYKAFAPDISTGGTTIKDVGKQPLSRKHTNPFKLWKLLISLMAVLMPVGAWAQGDGQSAKTAWSGVIDHKVVDDAWTVGTDGAVHVYIKDVTSNDDHRSRIRIKVGNNKDVVLHVAGQNKLKGFQDNNMPTGGSNHIAAIQVESAKSFTIVPTEEITNTIPILACYGEATGNAAGGTAMPGIECHSDFKIDGAVAVWAEGDAPAAAGKKANPVYMSNASVTLANGAYFCIHGNHQEDNNMPASWVIENFASAGRKAYWAIEGQSNKSYTTSNVLVSNTLQNSIYTGSVSENAFLRGYFGNGQSFVIPMKQVRDNKEGGYENNEEAFNYKFFVNNTTDDLYYAEFATTDGDRIPFAVRDENTDVRTSTYIGAAKNGDNYYAQLNQQKQGTYTLNVSQYPHSGTLSAENGDIKIIGDQTHRTMHIAQSGFELDGSSNTITLEGIEIPTGHSIKVKGDVRLGDKGYSECEIKDAAKFGDNDEDVYYCIINYSNTELMENEDGITIKDETGSNQVNYPFTLDKENNKIYAWLPQGTTFQITDSKTSPVPTIQTKSGHYQEIFVSEPIVYIGSQGYNTLSAAFLAAQPNDVIYLKDNYNTVDGKPARPDDTNITESSTFTLNLNGYTLGISTHPEPETGKLPLISSGKGTLEIKSEAIPGIDNGTTTGSITGNYRIDGIVYSTLSLTAHIEGIEVSNKQSTPKMSKQSGDMPTVITYDINGAPVNATRLTTTDNYCLWIPTTSKAIGPVKDADGTIFAQIKNDGQDNYSLDPLFDLNSYSISVDATSGVTYGLDGNKYVAAGFGNSTTAAEIVTVAEDKYNTANTLTVNGNAHVILKDIYKGLQTGDGKVGNEDILTRLEVTGTGNADIKTSGINSIGTITIAQDATLVFNQLEETPATANALRFATINAQTAQGTLKVESGTLLAYLNDKKAGQINVATATYKGGSVRAKFETNTNRFTDETAVTPNQLYRVSFKVSEYYTPYDYEYTQEDGTTQSGKVTSDKNGEIHLWMPKGKGGKARFTTSASLTNPTEEIIFSAVTDDDGNIAPANIGLYEGDKVDVNNKVGSYKSLADAFEAMGTDKNYTVALYTAHTESNTDCDVKGTNKQVTIDLNGYTLNCHNVTFETTADNFMLITNNAASTDPDAEKHATISGDITVSQNVYISKNVHMEGIHVDMINPKYVVSGDEPELFKGVRRLLVKGLEENIPYYYEYAEQQIEFTVKQKMTDDTGLACLWLVESMYPQEFVVYKKAGGNAENGLTVPGNELAIVAHSNNYTQLVKGGIVATVTANQDVNSFRTLSAAIDFANKNYTTDLVITLLENIQSQATFDIAQNYAIDLNGHDLTFTQGGFNASSKLTIKDGKTDKKGILAGVIKLINKENVSVDPAVTIGGVVVDALQATPVNIYRLMVDGDVDLNTWVETPERDTDKQYGTTYEYTIPAGLANHSTTVKGYKVVTINDSNGTDWNNLTDCNIVINKDVTWSVPANNNRNTIHRLTIHEGGKVDTQNGNVTATDGIRYVRTFEADKWSLIALPFTATDITKKEGDKVISISPAADPGTSGHFWLHTIKNDGSTTDVTDSEMTANKVYVMKVPNSLLNQEITFVSGPNQMLRRDKVLAPDPISGFVAYANGTLNEVSMNDKKYYYTLDEVEVEGVKEQMFVRKNGTADSKIAPFSGYLLADAATANTTARLSLRSTPTANEEIEIAEDELQIRTEAGRIILTTEMPVQVVICDLKGTVKFSGEIPAGDSSYEVGTGIYIINNQKVIVK